MRIKSNPSNDERIKLLEQKVETLRKNYASLYDWVYSHRVRRTDADKLMLNRAKIWSERFLEALKKGSNIRYITRHGKNKGRLKYVIDKK